MKLTRTKNCLFVGIVVLLTLFSFSPTSHAASLDRGLLMQVPGVVKYLQEKGYRKVGVLPFRLRLEEHPPTFHGSSINNNMTERLENALALVRNPEKPIQVISQARKTAQTKLVTASYRTPSDRKRLFDLSYELAVKDGPKFVVADVFLTGELAANRDLTKATVKIDCFDKMHPEKYIHLLSFEVPVDRDLLADMGQGFSPDRRGAKFTRGLPSPPGTGRSGTEFEIAKTNQPIVAKKTDSLVQLTVCYDNQSQDLMQDSANPNNWAARAPAPSQKVVFDLRNTTDRKVGVVLLINGYNTLYHEYGLESHQWSRWILEPGKEYRIKGVYERNRKVFAPFEGISSNDLRGSTNDFADAVGVIQMHLFTSERAAAAAESRWAGPSKRAKDCYSLGANGSLRRVPPEQVGFHQPKTWVELNRQITGTMAFQGGRGVIAGSEEVKGATLSVDSLETPYHAATVVLRMRNDSGKMNP
ncbi:MAG: hypothetical protein WCJ35_14570 [Planctomycetota bacterium]